MRTRSLLPVIITFFLIISLSGFSLAQLKVAGNPTEGKQRLLWFEQHKEMMDKSFFKNYEWSFAGPQWMSGRISDIEAPANDPFTLYVASASGGLWKTINEGTTWIPLFDKMSSTTMGDIAVSSSNPDIVWVGTGENNSSRSTYSGTGVFKSTNAGQTFTYMGLEDSHHIGRIVIHPSNPDIVYVASIGSLYSYNRQRGIYKTTDGGENWEEVLFVNEQTGFIDLALDSSNPEILYAAAWDRLRRGWEMWEYGPGSGMYKTVDGGKNWTKLTNGFPAEGTEGRIGLAVSPSNPNVVYASIDNHGSAREAEEGETDVYGLAAQRIIKGLEVYRSDDKGESWNKVNETDLSNVYYTYGYYFGEIRVDPENEDNVWVLGVPAMKSEDGGKTFSGVPSRGMHGDYQSMWVDPADPNRIVMGNDGGLNISYDGGENWKDIKNLPVVQFYHVNVDMAKPFNIYGTVQDHGCFMGPYTHDPENDIAYDWKRIPGGEASYLAVDPTNKNMLYDEGYYGSLERSNLKKDTSKSIKPQVKEGAEPLRNTWLTPFIISSHNPFIIYFGSQYLHRSLDKGETWQTLSPDLTDNDEQRRGDVPFGSISTISESQVVPGLVWVGTDDGNVHITRNSGVEWNKVEGLEDVWVSRVEASHRKKCTAYVSLNGYRDDNFNVYLYKVSEFGAKVTDIGKGIPGGPINVIKEDPKNPDVLYVGTDTGVYISLNGGESWDALMAGMPTTFVQDLVVHPRDNILVAGTHGRGVYVIDVGPVQEFKEEVKEKDLHLFDIKKVKRPLRYYESAEATITFVLKDAADVNVEIMNKEGEVIASENAFCEKGFNQIVWDLRVEGERRGFADTGTYKVRISDGINSDEAKLKVK